MKAVAAVALFFFLEVSARLVGHQKSGALDAYLSVDSKSAQSQSSTKKAKCDCLARHMSLLGQPDPLQQKGALTAYLQNGEKKKDEPCDCMEEGPHQPGPIEQQLTAGFDASKSNTENQQAMECEQKFYACEKCCAGDVAYPQASTEWCEPVLTSEADKDKADNPCKTKCLMMKQDCSNAI
uniref:Uncharacterized protein n=1 Tax=Chromera velia CCMP2878 TaxID=1169474 RepID=A0A0G4F9Q3_9ALVE|mmetsp:Transcript_53569/g.104760  ORF Transcript_53569/g.104760 Transcript_53569/m.104760 type:complete len:181 (+) Transcript_53569:171-713(+)|eukprot:Cvel_15896.t1-p1 / transcript=Cvel_15896.t1 / gene=Cvel_15896 / organism=Chromera_velia_CCMP2878 / gene_product=hypothetical protein / transcript_product=hypothetical protein / location=Cvel_scaffold1200:47528-51407(+) / protein_length=180 / sequence_SO=supercontig / SO=protein_coding / is_pseudo=false